MCGIRSAHPPAGIAGSGVRGVAPADDHVFVATGEVDQGRADDGQDDAEGDLGPVESGTEARFAHSAGDDDARRDADAAGEEAAQPGFQAPIKGSFREHLTCYGADDAG